MKFVSSDSVSISFLSIWFDWVWLICIMEMAEICRREWLLAFVWVGFGLHSVYFAE